MRRPALASWPLLAALALLLQACAAPAPYQRPALELPARFKEGGLDWAQARPGSSLPAGDWWTLFGDSELNRLEAEVAASNHDLKAAAARAAQARAAVQGAQAAGAPQLSAGIEGSRAHVSSNVVGRSLAGRTTNDFSTPLTLSWELDLWGRVASGVSAATADAQAGADDVGAVRLALQSQAAMAYFQLRALDAEKLLLDHAMSNDAADLALTRQRQQAGIASDLDLAQAQAVLDTARTELTDLDIARSAAEHALATLTGRPASGFSLAAAGGQTALPAPPAMPVALPSELLQRRPDIAAAERRVAAANARIGVAQAAFYPSLTLGGSAGLESARLAELAALPSHFWALGPMLAGAIFDGGARESRLHQADAAYDVAAETFRQQTLQALQEVEDSLAALRLLADEDTSQGRAAAAAAQALALTRDRYRVGTVSYLEVLVAESADWAAQQRVLDIQRRRLQSSVQLMKALGGGWQAPVSSF
ncbi:MAG: RND transporter [Roseateles depolymerans]|uniref:RND transporter n=1 Tax=Roseateles depolymerans TaxID=76731 RepID=A0A2W5DQM0_9BURK|nr:MAG: RND transporter [Roseateles depolymerans]